jgi:multiple sugar transport system permease protein
VTNLLHSHPLTPDLSPMQVPHTEAAPAPETRATAPEPGNGARRVDSGGKRLRRRRNRFAWWLIAPALTFMLLVHVLPTLAGLYVSFLRLNTFTLPQLFAAPWNGLQNYKDLFSSTSPLHDGFFQAARNTVEYTTLVVVGTVGGGLGVALLLNRTFPGRRLVRTLMLLPWVVPSFVAATLFQFMLQRNAGIVNKILVDYTHLLHHRPSWLLGPNTMWAIVIPSIWRGLPLPMLFFLAGLQTIPSDLHEAAKMDGAGAWRRFRYITLPLLRPLLAIQLLIGVIYAAYQFVIPYIMLGSDPGPHADVLMTLIVRQSFENSLFGLGAAISTLLMLAMCVWVLIWYRAFRRDFEVATA